MVEMVKMVEMVEMVELVEMVEMVKMGCLWGMSQTFFVCDKIALCGDKSIGQMFSSSCTGWNKQSRVGGRVGVAAGSNETKANSAQFGLNWGLAGLSLAINRLSASYCIWNTVSLVNKASVNFQYIYTKILPSSAQLNPSLTQIGLS